MIHPATITSDIALLVSRTLGVSIEDLRGRRRIPHIAHARQVAFYLARRGGARSYDRIGYYFGRDHSTVISGVRRIEKLIQSNHPLSIEVDRLAAMIGQVNIKVATGGDVWEPLSPPDIMAGSISRCIPPARAICNMADENRASPPA